jgi:glucose/arabinose dehydrogenase
MIRTLLIATLLVLTLNCAAQPFTKTPVCTGINFGVAFDVAYDGRFFVTEKGVDASGTPAQIKVFDAAGNFLSVFYDLSDSALAGGEAGLLGIALDPNFSSNHYVYAYLVYAEVDSLITNEHLLIQRFTEVNNAGTQPVLIFDYPVDSVTNPLYSPIYHVGGNIHFRPSDTTHIYVTIGDMFTGYTDDTPARLDNPLGKILRISKYPHQFAPSDNPFYDDGNPYTGNCDWIWAYGFRNSFDFCFGPNDSLYATENGTSRFDEVNLVTRGGFYGWPYCEGPVDEDTATLPCHAPGSILPLIEFPLPLPALTGILFYTDTVWSIQQNRLIITDFNHADLTHIYLNNAPAYNSADTAIAWIDGSNMNGFTDIAQAPDGCFYVLEFGDSVFGGIYRICPVDVSVAEVNVLSSVSVAPNPFHESSTLTYSLVQAAAVNVSLYDVTGRFVATLVDDTQTAGVHTAEVNARQLALSPGVYTCVLRSEEFSRSVRLIVE